MTTSDALSTPADAARDTRRRSVITALWAAAASAVCLAAGGLLTRLGMGEWYRELAKPSWQPPAWAFSAAWTLIFSLKAVAVWLVARRGFERSLVKMAVTLYGVQLVFNVGWSALFFVLQNPTLALVEIVALDVLVLATIVCFQRVSKWAGAILVPYAVWLGFATAINGWIVAHTA